MNLQLLCNEARLIIATVAGFIKEQSVSFDPAKVEQKGFNDLVSYVDKTSEKMLVEKLAALLPGSGFIAEENTAGFSGERYKWIIDPLDGTTNFVHGVPCFCISVALSDNDRLVMGIIHEINMDECFYSWSDAPAYLNGSEIHVSNRSNLSEALIVTGFPYTDFSRWEGYMKVFDYCMRNTHGIRRPGSAAADLAYVACGRFEAFYEYGLNAWDVAAGAFIVQQAGGKVSGFKEGVDYVFGKEIIAANDKVYDEFYNMVNSYMYA
jgi:myo-inositol-1(or 4)-monophosphatase